MKHLHLYLDDSGSRDLDRPVSRARQDLGSRWFALGGMIVREEDEAAIRAAHASFVDRWNIAAPLHSYELRSKKRNFAWVGALEEERRLQFYSELYEFLTGLPVRATACVIDRQGYNDRYRERYGLRRWAMSKTAFSIVVERAAKTAHEEGRKLKVWFEQHSKAEDQAILRYFSEMRCDGMPFNPDTSSVYGPLGPERLGEVLSWCQSKNKSSPMIQIADLLLFPLCVGRYDPDNRAYRTYLEAGLLIDQHLRPDEVATRGIKYSCFDHLSHE